MATGRELTGRVALVTGAGRGIGRATALGLAADGATVIVNDRDDDPVSEVIAAIAAQGGTAHPMCVSVTEHERCAAMTNELVDRLGGVDILVSNAGVASSGKSLLRTPLAEAESLMQVNAFAPLTLCQAVLPSMRAKGWGRIVVVSSMAVREMSARGGSYNMAKAALEAFAYTLAKEEHRNGIRVNIVAPGFTDTRLAHLVAERVQQGHPGASPALPEMQPPAAIADAIRFYTSDAAAHVNSQNLLVGG